MSVVDLTPVLVAALTDLGASPYLLGLEKESLRIDPTGTLARTAHPAALGAALTHPHITTDFSEALLELVTPPLPRIDAVLTFLADLHAFVVRHLGSEQLWAASMPCALAAGVRIPLARYGTSNAGVMKTVYRRGLGHRYGRVMQLIAGVHVNFSLSEALWTVLDERLGIAAAATRAFRDARYMGMIRNLQRWGWLVPYLFGASPAVCKSFVQQAPTALQRFDDQTYYLPYATSLRMGDIGYQNRQEEGTGIKANYDSLDSYIRSLTWAIETPCPLYEAIGVKVGDRYEQLNDHVLQIENEYYSTVRPKPLVNWLERPTLALRRRGIRYVELRSPDVNIYEPLGIAAETLYFLATFMLYAWAAPSPRITPRERQAIDANQALAAHRGREPGLCLERDGRACVLRDWAAELLERMMPVALALDRCVPDGAHGASVAAQRVKVLAPEATPAARILAEMRAHKECFSAFGRRLSARHHVRHQTWPLAAERAAWLRDLAAASWAQQRRLEAEDTLDFDTFLARYFAQQLEPSAATVTDGIKTAPPPAEEPPGSNRSSTR